MESMACLWHAGAWTATRIINSILASIIHMGSWALEEPYVASFADASPGGPPVAGDADLSTFNESETRSQLAALYGVPIEYVSTFV